jgi:hypothetical protein
VTSSVTAADAASSCRSRLVDLHLRRLGPASRIDLFPDDLDDVADKMDDLVSGCAQNVPKKVEIFEQNML